ncbi:RuBisCO large subunit C-terminal-like domain-containing protein [Meiothermus sp.]|uniref:RuBisCO large subunit C-terminal-like domain-containing protein n=1 Tax=Meiothermus sp. TaxID=1955249 RepID=UPI0021DDB8DC|nr:RuBisCO large subunit C-terminal-like domain-containing protein [Meiothermus sp.]GIW24965.1 MAG: ribulose-bisphosphate carboxylase [Meiothermus sp.]
MLGLEAIYHIQSTPDQIEARAEALAIEQSIEMPPVAVRQPEILREVLAQVVSIQEAEAGYYRVVLRFAGQTTAFEAAGLLNVLFGNCALQEDVELIDLKLPPELLATFAGPRFGIAGLRQLTGVHDRPLTCTALKPQGLSPTQLAELAHTFALGGIDIVKDDHGLTNQPYAPFAERVPFIQKAIAEANAKTGGHTLYAPMLTGGPKTLRQRLQVARQVGVRVVLAAPMLMGLPTFQEWVEELEMAVLAHPAFAGHRIAPSLMLGKLFRLLGADASIFPNYGGRFAYSTQTCMNLAQAARSPWAHLRPTLPVPAGGMTVERVEEMVGFYGPETMLLIGGNLLAAGDKLLERTRAFVQKVAASVGQI